MRQRAVTGQSGTVTAVTAMAVTKFSRLISWREPFLVKKRIPKPGIGVQQLSRDFVHQQANVESFEAFLRSRDVFVHLGEILNSVLRLSAGALLRYFPTAPPNNIGNSKAESRNSYIHVHECCIVAVLIRLHVNDRTANKSHLSHTAEPWQIKQPSDEKRAIKIAWQAALSTNRFCTGFVKSTINALTTLLSHWHCSERERESWFFLELRTSEGFDPIPNDFGVANFGSRQVLHKSNTFSKRGAGWLR